MARANSTVYVALITSILTVPIIARAETPPNLAVWSEAEQWAWQEIRAGRVADFNARYAETLDPEKPSGWDNVRSGQDRRLSRYFISTLLLNAPSKQSISGQSIAIAGAWFPDGLALGLVQSEGMLIIRHSRFVHAVEFQGARIRGVSLEGITATGSVDFTSAAIAGALDINGGTFIGPVRMADLTIGSHLFMRNRAMFRADVDLSAAKVGGQIDMHSSAFTAGLDMHGISVANDLLINDSTFGGDIDLGSAKVDGNISVHGAKFRQDLNLNTAHIGSSLLLGTDSFEGTITIAGAKVSSQLNITKSNVETDLNMYGIMVGQNLRIAESTFGGDVDLGAANVAGTIGVNDSTFKRKASLNTANIGSNLILGNNSTFDGDVDRVAKIGLELNASNAKFNAGLDMHDSEVGRVVLLNQSTFDGDVEFGSAKVGGSIVAMHSVFRQNVSLNTADIGSSLLLGNNSIFHGMVDLGAAKVGGWLDASNVIFTAELNMYGIIVGREVVMYKSECGGTVDLDSAKIDGSFDATGSMFSEKVTIRNASVGDVLFGHGAMFQSEVAIDFSKVARDVRMSGATFKGGMTVHGASVGNLVVGYEDEPSQWGDGAVLDLTTASAQIIHDYFTHDEREELRNWPERIRLEGFDYQKIGSRGGGNVGDMLERSTRWFEHWLSRDKPFSPQPYHQLSIVLRDSGYLEKADDVLYSARVRERKQAWDEYDIGRWVFMSGMQWSIGYGIGLRMFRVLGWISLLTFIEFLILWRWSRKREDIFTFAYASLSHVLPVMQMDKHETLITVENLPRLAVAWFVFQRIVGWALGGFLIAALAGLTQKS